jgi:hypothetical protein
VRILIIESEITIDVFILDDNTPPERYKTSHFLGSVNKRAAAMDPEMEESLYKFAQDHITRVTKYNEMACLIGKKEHENEIKSKPIEKPFKPRES